MSNVTYMASRRSGTRAGVAPGRVRICVTLTEETFEALRTRADANHHGLSGEAALIIEETLCIHRVPDLQTKNAD